MLIDSPRDLDGLEAAGRVVSEALEEMTNAVAVGISTVSLDEIAAQVFARHGARSAPQLVYNFPGSTCISLNQEAVHGIPSARVLKDGDLVKLDVTAELDGYYADAAVTIPVGSVSGDALRVAYAAEDALREGLRFVRSGALLAEVGEAVESTVESYGCKVLRSLTGHGIGRSIHEDPHVYNYPTRSEERLSKGQVITLEPIISLSSRQVAHSSDGWTVMTADGSLSAHFEHTLVVTDDGPLLLTA